MNKKLALLFVVVFVMSIFAFGCQNTAQRPLNPNQNNTYNDPNMTNPINNRMSLTDSEAVSMANRLENVAEEVSGVQRATVIVSDMATDGMDMNNTAGNNNLGYNNNRAGSNNISNDMANNTGTANDTITGNNVTNNMNRMNDTNYTNNTVGLVVMVGLDLNDANMNNTTTMNNIKRTVANRIKASDNRISRVIVTTDQNMINRIENVASDMANGRTINNMRNDINNLMRNMISTNPSF